MNQAEKDLLDKIKKAGVEHEDAKVRLAKAKRDAIDAETGVINSKLHLARLREEYRIYCNTTPRHELSARDKEIEKFREDNPELVRWARERDGIEDK